MIYISGPISGVSNYLKKFDDAEYNLEMRYGDQIINPAKVLSRLPTEYLEYKDLMKLCLDMLAMCDTIYMMRGWRDSKGALLEYQFAKTHNFNIIIQK